MAKIKINKLPKGFELKNGKVVKTMQQGGMTTGDQFDFSLVKSPYSNMGNDNSEETSVRYSLSSVPRDVANLEAEGGETVLTDLNDDGKFGLYNITGPRHSSGGVPMYLPEQSFVFSDTQKMKFNKNELAEFGIESRKKMTPAQVSKRYQLNEFLGAMSDPDVDNIKLKSAELMLNKNQMGLSKLAFGQESKKKFSDGVPVTAHAYLISQGIDPIEFTQKVENITAEQAADRMYQGLPPEQRAQLMALKEMMSQAGQGEQPMAKYGLEKYQNKGETNTPSNNPFGLLDPLVGTSTPVDDWDNDGIPNFLDRYPYIPYVEEVVGEREKILQEKGEDPVDNKPPSSKSTSDSGKRNAAINEEFNNRLQKSLGITLNLKGIEQTKYADKQPFKGDGKYGDAEANLAGWIERWSPFYGEQKMNELVSSLKDYPVGVSNPKVRAFQEWVNNTHIPEKVKAINQERIDKGYQPLNETQLTDLESDFITNMGFSDKNGARSSDGLLGTVTTSRFPVDYSLPDKPEKKEEKPLDPLKEEELRTPASRPELDFYTQDLYKGAAIAMRDRDLFRPFRQELERPQVDYVLSEPTREIADINERYNIAAQALGAFGGRQGLDASLSRQSGAAMRDAANVFQRNKAFNIPTVNQGKMAQAQLDATFNIENAKRNDFEYDGTVASLQQRLNEKNADRNDFANWQADALTNAVGAYNLSSLYDQFDIDTVAGGTIDFTEGRKLKGSKSQSPEKLRQQRLQNMQDLFNQFGEKGLDAKLLDYMETGVIQQDETQSGNFANQYGIDPQILAAIQAASGSAKKGKEVRKYATPFYTGKSGI
jgi:hypothetical protein